MKRVSLNESPCRRQFPILVIMKSYTPCSCIGVHWNIQPKPQVRRVNQTCNFCLGGLRETRKTWCPCSDSNRLLSFQLSTCIHLIKEVISTRCLIQWSFCLHTLKEVSVFIDRSVLAGNTNMARGRTTV